MTAVSWRDKPAMAASQERDVYDRACLGVLHRRVGDGFGRGREGAPNLRDTCCAILLLEGLGQLDGLSPEDLHRMGGCVQAFQQRDGGLFVDPAGGRPGVPGRPDHGATQLAIQSLDALGLRPIHPLPRCREFRDEQAVTSWLEGLDWSSPRRAAEEVTSRLDLLVYEAEVEKVGVAAQLLHTVLDWLDHAQNSVSGLWGTGLSALSYEAVIAAYRLLPFYEYVRRPVTRVGRRTDWLLELLELGDPFGGGPDLPLAVAGLLAMPVALSGDRRDEIKRTLLWSHEAILSGLRMHMDGDHGSGPDDLEDTWPRMLTLATIASTYPDDDSESHAWQFRRWPGFGYHRSSPDLSQHERDVLGAWLRPSVHAVPELPADEAPAVSVVIPYFNMGRYLNEAIESVLAQTEQTYEIIVVDDGSSDEYSRLLLRELRRPRTRIVHQENRGVAAARNAGIREARGRYLCCLDPDDRLRPTYLAKALAVLESQPDVGFVTSELAVFDETDWPGGGIETCDLPGALVWNRAMVPSLFRRCAWERVGGYCEEFRVTGCEDWDFWLSVMEGGYRAAVIPEVLFEDRGRADSMSDTMLRTEKLRPMLNQLVDRHRQSYDQHVKEVYVSDRVEFFEKKEWHERYCRAFTRPRRNGTCGEPGVSRRKRPLERLKRTLWPFERLRRTLWPFERLRRTPRPLERRMRTRPPFVRLRPGWRVSKEARPAVSISTRSDCQVSGSWRGGCWTMHDLAPSTSPQRRAARVSIATVRRHAARCVSLGRRPWHGKATPPERGQLHGRQSPQIVAPSPRSSSQQWNCVGDLMSIIKPTVKKLARPFTRRLLLRMDARAAAVREQVITLQSDLQSDIDELKRCLPTVLNVISSQSAAAREWKRAELELSGKIEQTELELSGKIEQTVMELSRKIEQTEQRGEFIRRETMFEARYGAQARGPDTQQEPEIIDAEKVEAARDRIRLNLGCGHIPLDGYLNVDARNLPGVDIRAHVGRLPFEAGEVSEIFSAHLLEHFPLEELSRCLLPYWHSLLEAGGKFAAVVPDAQTMITEYSAGRLRFDDLRQVTFGLQEYDGDFHFNMFTPESLTELLEGAGFVEVRTQETGRRNGACYEMEIAASKPLPESVRELQVSGATRINQASVDMRSSKWSTSSAHPTST